MGFSPAGLFSRSAPRVQTTCREATAERRQPARRQPPPRSAGEGKLGLKKSSARRRYRGRADGAARASREELLVLPIREHMGRLRCPPPPAHGPSARCWGAWKEPPRGEQPPPRSEGRGAGARRFGGTTPSRAAPSAPAPTRAPAAPACLQAKPLLRHPISELGGGLGKGFSRAFRGIGALLGASRHRAAAPHGEGLGQIRESEPSSTQQGSPSLTGAVPDRGLAALVLPRLFHPLIGSLSDPLCPVCTAAARLAGGEFKGDRDGRGFSSHPPVGNTGW